jgi:PPM family protein phosphatase
MGAGGKMLTIACAGRTDKGMRRTNNEDIVVLRPDLGFIAVADGMGGAASGEIAAAIFANTVEEIFSDPTSAEMEASQVVQDSFFHANEEIRQHATDFPEHKGMGCTAELFALARDSYIVGHVGDSRTYLFRGGVLRQVTKDHSLLQDRIDKGLVSLNESEGRPRKNVILRAVGVVDELAIDLIRGRGQPADTFLLCSDGLTDMIADEEIARILNLPNGLDQKVRELIDAANDAGGYDNITVALCELR